MVFPHSSTHLLGLSLSVATKIPIYDEITPNSDSARICDCSKAKIISILLFHGGKCMKVLLRIRFRGKRGCDISSVPFKKLEKASRYRKKRWELKDNWLVLEA